MSEVLIVERDGEVVTLTLNDPPRRNAFGPPMRDALRDAVTALNADPSCRAVVLTGAGGHFCAGGDLRAFHETTVAAGRARLKGGSAPLMRAMIAGPKPIVAAVEGYAYGAGMALAAASDYVVTTSDARFCAAFLRVGFIPDLALLWSLPRRVGLGRAKSLIALSKEIDGAEAGRIGLADEVVGAGEALDRARVVAARLAEGPPLAFELLKSTMAEGLDEVLRAEVDHQSVLFVSADHAEGKAAFFEKRKPVFKGE